ncbi:MAG TPA: hypothetical protein VN449_04170 [Gaiellaceae bacterium]|jgi:DNA repair exonuclease SbcCD ATPase subunit|nr:hypothetical protein [Gaiellaceae bacterium]
MATEHDAKPTIEALDAERRRLQELERNLAAERNRIQAAAAQEIARLHEQLRDAADRAAKRERELESTKRKLERKAQGGWLAAVGLAAAKRSVEPGEDRDLVDRERALAAVTAALQARESALDKKVADLVEAERRSAEQLAARAAELEAQAAKLHARQVPPPVEETDEAAQVEPWQQIDDRWTLLEEREAELAQAFTALEHRERELERLRDDLEAEQFRRAEDQRVLLPRTAAPGPMPAVTFSDGLRSLARRRSG